MVTRATQASIQHPRSLSRARLLEQFNAGRIERHGETTGICLGIGAVGVKTHRRAAGDRPLDELDATRVVLRRLPDLDFEGTKAVFQVLFDFLLDVSRRGAAEWGEQRQTRVTIYAEQRMALEHFDCRDERGRRPCVQALGRLGDDMASLIQDP